MRKLIMAAIHGEIDRSTLIGSIRSAIVGKVDSIDFCHDPSIELKRLVYLVIMVRTDMKIEAIEKALGAIDGIMSRGVLVYELEERLFERRPEVIE